MNETIWYVYVAVLGLAIGSFLNVVIYRLPRKCMFARSRSACPHCEQQLKWYHNIPVLSFLALRGKCAFCGKPISWRYPLVEILNALVFVYFFHSYGLSWYFAAFAALGSALIVIFFIDYDFQIIPDSITLPGMALGLAVSFLPGGLTFWQSLTGLLVGGGALYAVAILGDLLFKKESMGGGDIKMAAMLGAFVGWQKTILIFMGSAVIGLVVSIAIMAISEKLRRERLIPFGPFIAMAAMIAIVYGDQIISFYLVNVVGVAVP
ncbi:MAG TPA: prepilin peptidase [candidate division Zixibacteria bacterium]|nr:prepilin peptidase [candidate division Zixibacteria bacterium]